MITTQDLLDAVRNDGSPVRIRLPAPTTIRLSPATAPPSQPPHTASPATLRALQRDLIRSSVTLSTLDPLELAAVARFTEEFGALAQQTIAALVGAARAQLDVADAGRTIREIHDVIAARGREVALAVANEDLLHRLDAAAAERAVLVGGWEHAEVWLQGHLKLRVVEEDETHHLHQLRTARADLLDAQRRISNLERET